MIAKKIFPRNLTAHADAMVSGNPVVTRPEDAVANCFPGLELDVRNLDRRFFPGLVFEFVAQPDPGSQGYDDSSRWGALLSYVDMYGDPDLLLDTDAARKLNDQLNNLDFTGQWYLAWMEQKGNRLEMSWFRPEPAADDPIRRQTHLTPLDGLFVWRLVRGLEADDVTIGLERRDVRGTPEVVLRGWRRRFTDEKTGVLNAAYQPGELLQSLCSPWTHDFRDCACHYWASNHPDVVLGEVRPGEPVLPDGRSTDTTRGTMRLDWLRSERRRDLAGGAQNTIPKNRPFQYDHYQINREWQNLAVVLQDQEIDSVYTPRLADSAEPFSSEGELVRVLTEDLAPLELALALEYLYACFTLKASDDTPPPSAVIAEDVTFMRHYLLLTAQSEMLHLRWANELLWELFLAGMNPGYKPVLRAAKTIPAPKKAYELRAPGGQVTTIKGFDSGFRPVSLQPFTPEAIAGFVFVEDPDGYIDSTYAKVIATLRQRKYPPHLADLAGRVAGDGVEHFSRFQDMHKIAATYRDERTGYAYLREVNPGAPVNEDVKRALELYQEIVANLTTGYSAEAKSHPKDSGPPIGSARGDMLKLYDLAEKLAREGIGIPFFEAT